MVRALVTCTFCQEKLGDKSPLPLGEFYSDGSFVVQRFNQSWTKIVGWQLAIYCGTCNRGALYIRDKTKYTLVGVRDFIFKILRDYEFLESTPEDIKAFVEDMAIFLKHLAPSVGVDLSKILEGEKNADSR